MKIKPRILKGFRDFLPEELKFRKKIIKILEDIFILNGFEGLETPTLEYFDILMNKYGEDEKLVYSFKDRGGREVAMRYDLTVPTARVLAQYQDKIKYPFKRYQIQPVWRADNPQKGRFREFYQCDIDIFGVKEVTAEAEVLNIAIDVFKKLGFKNFVIRINNRKILNGISKFIKREDKFFDIVSAIDKWDKRSIDETKEDLLNRNLSQSEVSEIFKFIDISKSNDLEKLEEIKNLFFSKAINEGIEGVNEIEDLFNLILDKDYIKYDSTIARGLSYYTGPIYEVEIIEGGVGSVASGGRYDNLIGSFSGLDVPATGFSFGLERIIEVMKDRNISLTSDEKEKVLLVNFKETIKDIFLLARKLREEGKIVFIYPEAKKLSKQLQFADKKGFKFVYILGEDELKNGIVIKKDLESGTQERVDLKY